MSAAAWHPRGVYPAPIDFLTAEPDNVSDDELVHALLHVLEQVAERLVGLQEAEAHVVRCLGCGSWAWDEHRCGTCAAARSTRRRRRRSGVVEAAAERS